MLTDSGTKAMSDNQISSMLQADDAYSGSQSFYRMEEALREVFGKHYVMSVREIEAMAVGLRETLDETVIGQSPSFIEYAVNELDTMGIPVVMPAGALGCHIDALQFLPHVSQLEY